MSDAAKTVEYGKHGRAIATFVCQHLVRGSGLGFFCSDDPEDPYPDAWCGKCDKVLEQEGDWNETSEAAAKVTLICHRCYEAAQKHNLKS